MTITREEFIAECSRRKIAITGYTGGLSADFGLYWGLEDIDPFVCCDETRIGPHGGARQWVPLPPVDALAWLIGQRVLWQDGFFDANTPGLPADLIHRLRRKP